MNDDELIERQQTRLKLRGDVKKKEDITAEDVVMGIIRERRCEGLHRAFVIEALRFYSSIIAAKVPKPIEQDDRIIPEEVWHEVGVDIKERMDTFIAAQRS